MTMPRRMNTWWMTAMLLGVLPAACSDSSSGPDVDGQTRLSVYLTDAPGDVENVWVQVNDIVLVGDDGQTSLLAEPTDLINVSELHDSAVELVGDAALDAGTYHEVRLMLGGAVLESTNGGVFTMGGAEHPDGLTATGDLKCPSCSQTGIKVKLSHDITLTEGDNGLLIDFDIAQSFGHEAGNSGHWIMHPVIHATAGDPGELEDGAPEGEIRGTVTLAMAEGGGALSVPPCGGEERSLNSFVPTATSTTLVDDDSNALTFFGETDDEDGSFALEVTELDTFELGYKAEVLFGEEMLLWVATVDPEQVVLTEAAHEDEGVVYTITHVECVAVTP